MINLPRDPAWLTTGATATAIRWTHTETPAPVEHSCTLHVQEHVNGRETWRLATPADLERAGYVPKAPESP